MIWQSIVIILIVLFFIISGVCSIILVLQRLDKHSSDSSVEIKFIRLKAPVGITYGILAIILGIILLKYRSYTDQMMTIENQKRTIDSLQRLYNSVSLLKDSTIQKSVTEHFRYSSPKSIFEGRVLVTAKPSTVFKDASIFMRGIKGLSDNETGPFSENELMVEKGKRFYFQTPNNMIWACNVIDDQGDGLTIEIFRD